MNAPVKVERGEGGTTPYLPLAEVAPLVRRVVPVKPDATYIELDVHSFTTEEGSAKIYAASPGTAARNRTITAQALMTIDVPAPPLAAQQTFNRLQTEIDVLKAKHIAIRQANAALIPATLERVFSTGGTLTVTDNGHGMTPAQFKKRWMTLRYDRLKHQGPNVTFPSGRRGFEPTRKEVDQADGYVQDIAASGAMSGSPFICAWVVGQKIAAGVERDKQLGNPAYGRVRAATFGSLVDTANARLLKLRTVLADRYGGSSTDELLNQVFLRPTQDGLGI